MVLVMVYENLESKTPKYSEVAAKPGRLLAPGTTAPKVVPGADCAPAALAQGKQSLDPMVKQKYSIFRA